MLDGSRRITLRNRRFLRKINPASGRRTTTDSGTNPVGEKRTWVDRYGLPHPRMVMHAMLTAMHTPNDIEHRETHCSTPQNGGLQRTSPNLQLSPIPFEASNTANPELQSIDIMTSEQRTPSVGHGMLPASDTGQVTTQHEALPTTAPERAPLRRTTRTIKKPVRLIEEVT